MTWCRRAQGTAKRWEQVAGYVRTRTVDEVLDMVKHGLKAGRFAPKQDTFAVAKKRQVLWLMAEAPPSCMQHVLTRLDGSSDKRVPSVALPAP